jgi:hypothetical protein
MRPFKIVDDIYSIGTRGPAHGRLIDLLFFQSTWISKYLNSHFDKPPGILSDLSLGATTNGFVPHS